MKTRHAINKIENGFETSIISSSKYNQNKVMHVEWNIHKKCPRLYYENLPDLVHYKVHALKSKKCAILGIYNFTTTHRYLLLLHYFPNF